MALSYSDGEIGQNSLEMIPFEEQEFGDFCAGEILVAGIKAETDYKCMYDSVTRYPSAQVGPITQAMVDAGSSPVISDAAILAAPNAVAVGSPGALSPFTKRQVDAANHDPINWPQTLTVEGALARRRNQTLLRHAKNAPTRPVPGGFAPTPVWGNPAGSKQGWCGLGSNPWGKLLLFTGLGLIGASLFERR